MKVILRLLLTGLFVGVLLFCVFGFMASYEAMSAARRWTWRAIYSVVGLSTLPGIAITWRGRRRKEIA